MTEYETAVLARLTGIEDALRRIADVHEQMLAVELGDAQYVASDEAQPDVPRTLDD